MRRSRGRFGPHNGPPNRTNPGEFRVDNHSEKPSSASAAVTQLFTGFQTELDAKNDRHERLIKLSRDVTIESKRAIFQLHRITRKVSPEEKSELLQEVALRLEQVRGNLFYAIALELSQEDPYRFLRAVNFGMQEYIEAVAFLHFLKEGTLVSYEEVQAGLVFSQNEGAESQEGDGQLMVFCPLIEYLLGIADIAGEVMRYALNSLSAGNLNAQHEVVAFLRAVYGGFSLIGHGAQHRDFNFKTNVIRQSLIKVERSLYVLRLRAEEVPSHMLAELVANTARQMDEATASFGDGDEHNYEG